MYNCLCQDKQEEDQQIRRIPLSRGLGRCCLSDEEDHLETGHVQCHLVLFCLFVLQVGGKEECGVNSPDGSSVHARCQHNAPASRDEGVWALEPGEKRSWLRDLPDELDCEERARDPEPSRRRLGQTLKKDESEPKEKKKGGWCGGLVLNLW